MNRSIREKVLLPYFGLVMVVTITLGFVSHQMLMSAVVGQQQETMRLQAREVGSAIAEQVNHRKALIKSLAHSDATERYATNYGFYSLPRLFAENSSDFPLLTYVNKEGVEEERTEFGHISDDYMDISKTTLFKQSAAHPNEALLSDLESGVLGEPTISFIYRRQDFFGTFGGVLRGAAPLRDLTTPAREKRIGELGFVTVLDEAGKVLSYPDKNRLFTTLEGDDESSQKTAEAAIAKKTGFERASILGVDGYVAYQAIPGTSWSLLMTLPYDEFIEVPARLRTTIIFISLITFMLLIVAGWLVSRIFTTPLTTLLHVTESIAKGDLSARANISSRDEFQILAEAFNHMIEERKKVEDSLRVARDEAQVAAKTKAEFLAKMSHEIRTPMNGIIGMTDYLVKSGLPVAQEESALMIKSSGDHLLRVVNEILDYSRLESGKIELDTVDFDIREVIEHAAELFSDEANKKGLELIPRVPVSGPYVLHGDEGRLKQLLFNLVGNAVKFTSTGEVVVSGSIEGDGDDARLRCEVRDTGIGIDKADIGKIFESFSQADSSTTREFGGTGLGLAICEQLAELMGGEIGIQSKPDEGSVFWFCVPIEFAARGEADISQQLSILENVRALVVEDNAHYRTVLRDQLAAWGMNTTAVAGKDQAITLLKKGARIGCDYKLVIIDQTLPGLDGAVLAEQIRGEASLNQPHIALLQAGPADAGLDDRFDARWVDSIVRKPVAQTGLLEILKNALDESSRTAPRPVAAPTEKTEHSAPTKGTILLVEDNPMSQRVAQRILEMVGCKAEIAENGEEAVQMFNNRGYDLVLMDCHMPVMDGYDATRSIRQLEARDPTSHHRVPIIALTASVLTPGEGKCFAVGMDDYLSKPYDVSDIRRVLERWLPTDPTDRAYSTAA
jgi:signal transduction histidine kinase/CheY-like chemotaxis protein